jgi:hypothetical protein
MFMGKAQLVELELKKLLMTKYELKEKAIENWSLGRVIAELKGRGLRADFVALLEELKRHRNYIAHELLVDDAIMRKLDPKMRRFLGKSLHRGLICVEGTIVVHDFLVANGYL